MDDSTPPNELKPSQRIPLGMSSFGKEEQQRFGQNVRLAMACIEGKQSLLTLRRCPQMPLIFVSA